MMLDGYPQAILTGNQVMWNDQTTMSSVQYITTSPAFKVVRCSEKLSHRPPGMDDDATQQTRVFFSSCFFF